MSSYHAATSSPILIIAFASLTLGCAARSPADSDLAVAQSAKAADSDLAAIRNATQRFSDVKVAEAEGFISPPGNMCVTADMMGLPPETGSMGLHYIHPQRLGITATAPRVDGSDPTIDWLKPDVLVYEPQADGRLELVAVEYLVFEKAWKAAGNQTAPKFHDAAFAYMADDPATPLDEAHGFEPHYDLHFYLYRDNPKGMLIEWNPAVSCKLAPAR